MQTDASGAGRRPLSVEVQDDLSTCIQRVLNLNERLELVILNLLGPGSKFLSSSLKDEASDKPAGHFPIVLNQIDQLRRAINTYESLLDTISGEFNAQS